MKTTLYSSDVRQGWTRTELLLVVACVGVLASLWLPALASAGRADNGIVCRSNLRRLMQAVQMYAGENRGIMPHPSWGTVGGSGAGFDNWAYATRLGDSWIPSVTGQPDGALQALYQQASQLWPYLKDTKVYRCPTDEAQTAVPRSSLRSFYLLRSQKLTSYAMNGAVIGFSRSLPLGRTHRLARFRTDAVILWERDEREPTGFSDAGIQPGQGSSARHSLSRSVNRQGPVDTVRRGCNWARIDGSAEFVSKSAFAALAGVTQPVRTLPNPLWCDPEDPVRGGG